MVVLWIEFSPAFLERFGLRRASSVALERWMFVFIALGVLLPTMHQSSLGSILMVMGYKLSPLWFTPVAAGAVRDRARWRWATPL